MIITDLVGDFIVEGNNQDEEASQYKGVLNLSLNENLKINAEWTINNQQKQFGTGFFKNNILVINFYYLGDHEKKYKGVVVYHFLTRDILDGFWSEKHADQNYLGVERCFRIENNKK